jgi:glycosyltransferase involved in cell wall biosynthesis
MISVVIRTLNEKAKLDQLLTMLYKQKCSQPFEIIVVDNESNDGTKELAEAAGAKVVTLPRKDFTYPKSMNLGVENSSGDIVVLTVGHALPISKYWLETSIKDLGNPEVAGMYGPCLPRKGAHLWEYFFYFFWSFKQYLLGKRSVVNAPGIMGATNCAMRKKLWSEHKFDESFELGGEDGEWANWAIKQGYKIILNPSFAVRHSHPMKNRKDVDTQRAYWHRLSQPTKFSREALNFRKDLDLKN